MGSTVIVAAPMADKCKLSIRLGKLFFLLT
jgi:hypothetical protein